MKDAGSALMAIGRGTGENRAIDAAKSAIDSPLLELSIQGAKGVLFNITGNEDLSMHELNEAAELIQNAADPDANIIFGSVIDNRLQDEVKLTLIATGFDNMKRPVALSTGLLGRTNSAGPAQDRDQLDIPAFLRRRQDAR